MLFPRVFRNTRSKIKDHLSRTARTNITRRFTRNFRFNRIILDDLILRSFNRRNMGLRNTNTTKRTLATNFLTTGFRVGLDGTSRTNNVIRRRRTTQPRRQTHHPREIMICQNVRRQFKSTTTKKAANLSNLRLTVKRTTTRFFSGLPRNSTRKRFSRTIITSFTHRHGSFNTLTIINTSEQMPINAITSSNHGINRNFCIISRH